MSGRVTHKVVIRHRADIAPQMRFRQGARILEITAVLDAGARGRLVCLCEERNL